MNSPIVSPRQVCGGTQSHEPLEDRRLSRARGPNEGGDGGDFSSGGSGAIVWANNGKIMGEWGESRGDLGENARIQPKCFDGFRSSFNLRKTIQKKMNIMNIFGK